MLAAQSSGCQQTLSVVLIRMEAKSRIAKKVPNSLNYFCILIQGLIFFGRCFELKN
jgi:hypothetical protein